MSKTILLADDSVTIQKVVELTFMEEDYEVVAVSSGEEALDRLEEIGPDLVVADVHMPGPSGFEVCREVKARHPEVPVLLLVGTFEPFDPAEGEAAGADRHLKKPFDSQELLQTVRELVPAEAAAEEAPAEPVAEADAGGEPGPPAADEPEALEAVAGEEAVVAPADSAEVDAGPVAEAVDQETVETAELAAVPAEARELSESEVDRVARRVVELLSDDRLREVAWEVVPDLAEVVIKDRLRELESQVE